MRIWVWEYVVIDSWKLRLHSSIFDPLGQASVKTNSENYISTHVRLSVRPHVQNLCKWNNFLSGCNAYYISGTVELAKWIIDDSCLVLLNYFR